MQAGTCKPGSLTDRVLTMIRAGIDPVPRSELMAALTQQDRTWLNRILDRLVVRGLVSECGAGFIAAEAPRRHVPVHAVEMVPGVPDALRPWIAAIIRRAHTYREARTPSLAVRLLKEAAAKIDLPHVRDDLLGLADLFAVHRELYPTVDPRPRAAA